MKHLFFHFLFLIFSLGSLAYIEKIRNESSIITKEKSIAKNVMLKVYGEGGREWDLIGEELISLGKEIKLREVTIRSGGYVIRSSRILFKKDRNTAELKGNVEIRGEALFVKTSYAFADFNRNLIRGNEPVQVWKQRNYIEGKGFTAFLNPLRVIIKEANAKHEM
jgi:hypothetical protein